MRALSVLLLSCYLVGCAGSPEQTNLWSRTGELLSRTGVAIAQQGQRLTGGSSDSTAEQALHEQVEHLLDQPRIDPMTRFLEQHATQHADSRSYQRIARERDSRCRAIGTRYARRQPTPSNLKLLRKGYQYSCPGQVEAFSQRVAASPVIAAPAANTATPPAASTQQQRRANSCYLLFAIKNYQQALPACNVAAESGDAKAQHHLAAILQINADHAGAFDWAQRSARQQHAPGQLLLAQLYQRGQGTQTDTIKALALIKEAADRGLAAAQYQAGMAYLDGVGTEIDPPAAQHWLERAAGQDDVAAQLQLADIHFNDRGAGQAGARQWLLRAASQGSATAQYRLGASYMDGTGGPPEYTEAYIWLSLTLLNGEQDAEPRIQTLARQLTTEQVHTARLRIESGLHGRSY
ncbi:hypothetical protein SAMN05216198_0886 [Halopseudomonas litoralis]|uniref:TPR repeat n=1 Tax=Halopseudomonas litoralis TaxID=797277 RepID=A0A1H1NEH4_9GAMM|nr:tetratricopeptide repeat protein [Halopseudomonas litoralis]SDR97312.1 hypothetical protein SAMN05216198_0886 [Halopseudomonas litoralis]